MTNPHFLGGLGAALSVFFVSLGSCIASVPSGIFAQHARGTFLSFVPIVISGVLAICGCIIAVILAHKLQDDTLTKTQGHMHLSLGLTAGLACLASGAEMAKFAASCVNGIPKVMKPSADGGNNEMTTLLMTGGNLVCGDPLKASWHFLMVLVFIEAIVLCGLIVVSLIAGQAFPLRFFVQFGITVGPSCAVCESQSSAHQLLKKTSADCFPDQKRHCIFFD